jgi:hypothetical protein
VTYSDVQDGAAGTGNISSNPAFAEDGSVYCPLYILDGSPCVDAGDPSPAYNDGCFAPVGTALGGPQNDMGVGGGPLGCATYGLGVDGPSIGPGRSMIAFLGPNPSHGRTNLELRLSRAERVRVALLDLSGRKVLQVLDGDVDAGVHFVRWDFASARVPPGIYFVRVDVAGRREGGTIVFVR